jgi:hypothetical protein
MSDGVKVTEDEEGQFVDEKKGKEKKKGLREVGVQITWIRFAMFVFKTI